MSEATPMTHPEFEEMLGAYALDALDPDEAALVEDHLSECVRCSAEVARHHEVAGLLANSGGDAPGEIWDRISGRLTANRPPEWDQLAARLEPPSLPGAPAGEPEPGSALSEPSVAGVLPLHAAWRRSRWVTRTVSLVAAAAAVLAIVLGVQVNHLNRQVNAMTAAMAHPAVSGAAVAALESPSSQLVRLASTAAATGPTESKGATATIVLTKSGTGYLIGQGLATLPSNQTYQLWGSIDGQLISLGVLGPHPTITAFSFDSTVRVQAFAITAEQGGGVVQTTHQPLLAGTVKA